ncbi:MAG: Sec-independent protein translocase protein TatB [Candidatus Accumulibacter sp.]|jgi:sec-independent protein translocase protein TatB|nr:Sec-independent protein translocase protein TatB [Accumulibacter sp.]
MFEISISELMVLAIVGLVVVGPERLPKVARAAGLFIGRLRRYANDVRADIEREMRLDELKKARTEIEDSMRRFEGDLDAEFRHVERALDASAESINAAFGSASGGLKDLQDWDGPETTPAPEEAPTEAENIAPSSPPPPSAPAVNTAKPDAP